MKLSPASLTFLALALCSVAAASALGSWPIKATDFVKVNGLRLENSKGESQYLTGINYWACLNLAADADQGGEYGRVIIEMDQMQAVGINHLRIMAGSEGNPTPQPFRMNPPLQPSPGEYNEKIFVGLDRCLAEMAKRGMRATMTLNDQWQWSGGFAQYVSWTHGNEAVEYPPSWNLSAPPQRPGPPGRGWGNYTTTGDWNNYITYGDQFYTDDAAENLFKAHIDKILNRRNTVNGRIYKEDATVMVWQLANEPQPKVPTTFLGPYGLQLPPDPSDPLLDWVRK
jgi:mannan endo-1,4-beta-mannosidase